MRAGSAAWTDRAAPGGAVFVAPEPEPEGARIRFFTRLGGVSEAPYDSLNVSTRVGDGEAAVSENLSRIRGALEGNTSAWVRQVAGDRVLRVAGSGLAGEGDALVTESPGLPLVVAVADCLPVAVVGEREVAMAHSGWRGTLAGVAGNAVREMDEDPADLRAYIGPGIRECCYEVSEDIAEGFADRFGPEVVSGRNVSLPGSVARDLEDSGVGEVNDLGLCTGCRTDLFYSHRMEGPRTGRNLAAVQRLPRGAG
ncbi:MAG: laccase domain-containing protein [Rubrobacter sp.]|nr:laccase domain-containing protein [Rubrobacter sp.]